MLRIVLLILIAVTVTFWWGYYNGKAVGDTRPICFVTYIELNKESKQVSEIFLGYFERPKCNDSNIEFYAVEINGRPVYFFLEKNALFEEADGKQVVLTINIGRYSRNGNTKYLAYLFNSGTRILLEKK